MQSNELNQAVLKGAAIYGAGDEKISIVSHLRGAGTASQVVIDVGGILAICAKPVAVPVADLDFMRDEAGDVHAITPWTKMPEHLDQYGRIDRQRHPAADDRPNCR